MLTLVLSFSGLTFTLVILLFYKKGKDDDLKARRFLIMANKFDKRIDEELEKSFFQRFILPMMLDFNKKLLLLMPKKQKNNSQKLEKDLKMAGLSIAANEFITIKFVIMIFSIAFALIAFLAIQDKLIGLMALLFMSILGVLAPRYYLQAKVNFRQNAIKNQMPDVMDILSVSMEAGLGFDAAIIKISKRTSGPFIEELIILNKEMQMGKQRKDALKALADRSSVEELKTFSSSAIQADKLGIPIKNVLKIQSAQLRLGRKQTAQEKGMKAPIKMMLPLVLFIFPVIFIILLGPTILQLMTQFKK